MKTPVINQESITVDDFEKVESIENTCIGCYWVKMSACGDSPLCDEVISKLGHCCNGFIFKLKQK